MLFVFRIRRAAGGATHIGDQRSGSSRWPARMIHEGSSRTRADAKRDGHSEQGTGGKKKGASHQQYVEELNGETARHSRVSARATDAS
jgi:hypothetical protein